MLCNRVIDLIAGSGAARICPTLDVGSDCDPFLVSIGAKELCDACKLASSLSGLGPGPSLERLVSTLASVVDHVLDPLRLGLAACLLERGDGVVVCEKACGEA